MPNRSPGEPPADEQSPSIPSFASLRDPGHRRAVDLLMGGPLPVAAPVPTARRAGAAPLAGAPRPAEYADLLRFGMHVARVAASLPVRAATWSVREPVRCLRRLVG